jgi:AraC-like DNA-binding protein
MRLLKDEKSLNILEIAIQCGFNNTANFNKVFKKITSMTPSNYRLFGDVLS